MKRHLLPMPNESYMHRVSVGRMPPLLPPPPAPRPPSSDRKISKKKP